MTDLMYFVPGLPVILKVDGSIDMDRHRPRAPGESILRLPTISRPAGQWAIALHQGGVLDALPVGTKIVFATFALSDDRSPPLDGKTVILHEVPPGTAVTFSAKEGITLAPAEGLSLKADPPWDSVMLTKTGDNAWTASGALVPS